MTAAILGIVALSVATGAWAVALSRTMRASSDDLTEALARLDEDSSAPVLARMGAALERVASARTDLEAAGSELGRTLGNWDETLKGIEAELSSSRERTGRALAEKPASRLTVAVPGSSGGPKVAFATNGLVRFPNRSPGDGRPQRDPRDTLGLAWDQPVQFVVPTLWIPATDTTASRWTVVTEDVLAVRAVDGWLRDRWPDAEIRTRITDGRDQRPPEEGNIIAFCRDVRNPVTAAILNDPRTRALFGFSVGFVSTPTEPGWPPEWGIVFADEAPRVSPSYAQERALGVSGADDRITVLEDLALLARFPNPRGSGNALVIAGVRAMGTWGAAEYLRQHADELHDRTGGTSFAGLLRVRATYEKYPAEADGAVELLLLAAEDTPPTAELLELNVAA